MRPFTSTISLDEARKRLAAAVRPIERTERVRLEDANGRVAAGDAVSPMDVPPFARSAMDGYAVIAADTAGATGSTPVSLRLLDRIYTGEISQAAVTTGTCAEIATGAPLPSGADAVVMVEETAKAAAALINILAPATSGQNVGRRGADIAGGDRVIMRGDVLTPSRIGALAAIGCNGVEVFAKPRVAILSTGNEVVEPGTPLRPRRAAEDTIEALTDALDAAAHADLVVFSGGSSVGERDLIVDAIRKRGEIIFHGIAVKPGKPTAFALLRGTPFFGMPGNPTSCLSNAYILLVPFLRTMARLPPHVPRTIEVALGRAIVSGAGRHQFYTVKLRDGAAFPAFKGSGDITSLSQADGYIEIPADLSRVDEGTTVEVTLF
jgi:molybdopterin molybdotransferase